MFLTFAFLAFSYSAFRSQKQHIYGLQSEYFWVIHTFETYYKYQYVHIFETTN